MLKRRILLRIENRYIRGQRFVIDVVNLKLDTQ